MSYVDKIENNTDMYFVLDTTNNHCKASKINKRFIRQALFENRCRVYGVFSDDLLEGILIIANEQHLAIKSRNLLFIAHPRQVQHYLKSLVFSEETSFPSKIRVSTIYEEKELETASGFSYDAVIKMMTLTNHLYSFGRHNE
jgi:hypothetical protein